MGPCFQGLIYKGDDWITIFKERVDYLMAILRIKIAVIAGVAATRQNSAYRAMRSGCRDT